MSDKTIFEFEDDPRIARRRIMAQGLNILRAIAESYNTGMLEDPIASKKLCTMFSLIAEGRVTGHFDEQTCSTKWNLTEDYMAKLREVEEAILSQKLVPGPWQ